MANQFAIGLLTTIQNMRAQTGLAHVVTIAGETRDALVGAKKTDEILDAGGKVRRGWRTVTTALEWWTLPPAKFAVAVCYGVTYDVIRDPEDDNELLTIYLGDVLSTDRKTNLIR